MAREGARSIVSCSSGPTFAKPSGSSDPSFPGPLTKVPIPGINFQNDLPPVRRCRMVTTDFGGHMVKRAASKLYNWVALMIILGALLVHFYPVVAVKMQPLADGFINLIKMLIPPVILCSVVLGIAGSGSIKKAGRVGGKALLY